jgi:hypothetical protein
MKLGYWLLLAGLAFLYVKYYHVLGSRFLILLVSFYAFRLLLRRLSCMGPARRDMKAKENPRDKAVDADFEIIEDDKN